MTLLKHWQDISTTLASTDTRLLAVSKYTTDEAVQILINAGQLDFAESRPQNLRDRAQKFPQIHWHFIGPLQKNKAKYIAEYAAIWHSLADLETAKMVAKHLKGRSLPCLIQVNISGESQKQGVQPDMLDEFYAKLVMLPALQVIGLMGMAAKGEDVRLSFQTLRKLRDDLQKQDGSIRQLCMGMSGDWKIAVQEGATMVRLGSTLFSEYPLTPCI
ncbi:MAG: YggS family pyridoxal phosphate-dependent enzyme [Zetaproteobacteria bacterium]|nr:YggS family pyridoxal phosphate-dependent enzyme [Zetaproteobacteria bacterium]